MTFSSLVLLLQLAAALLVSVQSSATPLLLKEQAVSFSSQAVELVKQGLQGGGVINSVDELLDVTWKKTFHWSTFFENLSGFVTGGTVYADGSQMVVHANPSSGGMSYILKQAPWQGLATFSQKSYFRTSFLATDDSNMTGYIVVGRALNAYGDQYYGFKVVNSTLYGVASDNGTDNESVVVLGTILPDRLYNIEARYYPGEKVLFYVNPSRGDQVPKGTLTNNLPSTAEKPNMHLMNVILTTRDGQSKHFQMSYFEYLQKRDVLE